MRRRATMHGMGVHFGIDGSGVAGILRDMAAILDELGRDVRVNFGVDEEVAVAIASLPTSEIVETICIENGGDWEVIQVALGSIGHVRFQAQVPPRQPTSLEVEAAGSWREFEKSYRVGHLRRRAL